MTDKDIHAFEQYAFAVLRADAAAKEKPLFLGNELPRDLAFLDAHAPDGLLDITGPVAVQVTENLSSRKLETIASRLAELMGEPVSLLFVARRVPTKVREFAKADRNIHVLDSHDLEKLSERYPEAAAPFRPSLRKEAIESLKSGGSSDDRDQNLAALSAALRSDRLALFLGAGVSASAGLPDWNGLLKDLATTLFRETATDVLTPAEEDTVFEYFQTEVPSSPLIVARLLRENFSSRFADKIRRALYRSNPRDSQLLAEISALCLPARNRMGPPGVVTFNFDDLLERELARRGVAFRPIFSEGHEATREELPIYHVHGYLPSTEELTKEAQSSLVFSEEAYHAQSADPYSWSNITQLNLLRSNVCLFVGLSMSDPNLRRLLEITITKKPATRHYAILKDHWNSTMAGKLTGATSSLPRIFRGLEEGSLSRLGVSVIWVGGYDEIPELLRLIRQ